MSDTSKNENSDLDDLLAAYNIAVTDDKNGGGGGEGNGGEKSSDNFLEPPAAKRSKRKNYVPHKPRHFLGEEGEDPDGSGGGERRSPSPSERTTTPTPTSSRGSSRGPTPTPVGGAASSQNDAASDISAEDCVAIVSSVAATPPTLTTTTTAASSTSTSAAVSPSNSGGFNVSELRRHLQHQSRLQPTLSSSSSTMMTRPTIEPSEIYVAPNQPSISVSNIRSMAPSAATQLLNQQRKMAAAAKIAQQQQQQLQQQQQQHHHQKRTAPVGSTIVSAPIMLIPVSGTTMPANSTNAVRKAASITAASPVHQSIANNQSLQQQLQQQQQQQHANVNAARTVQTTLGVRNVNIPRMSIVENPNYIPPKKVSVASSASATILPRTSSTGIGVVAGVPGAAVLSTGVLGVPSGGMIGVVTPGGVAAAAAAANIPQSVRSDKFIASQVLKNQATLQKHSLQVATASKAASSGAVPDAATAGSAAAAVNVAPIVNFVSHAGGAVIAVPPGGVMTPLITTTTTMAPSTVASSSLLSNNKTAQVVSSTQQSGGGAPHSPAIHAVKTLPRDVVKNILTKKYVTPYKPKEMPPSVVLNKMASGELPGGAGPFSCTDCGDIFWMRSSYDNHRARRSMKLTLNCKWCECNLTFYNKCVMLEHAREHSAKDQSLDLAKVVISPIPRELVSAGMNAAPLDGGDESGSSSGPANYNVNNSNNGADNNHVGSAGQEMQEIPPPTGNPTLLVPTNLLINQQIAFTQVVDSGGGGGGAGAGGGRGVVVGGGGGGGGKDGKPASSTILAPAKALIPVQTAELTASFLPNNASASASSSGAAAPSSSSSSSSSVSSAVAASLPKGGLLKCPECAIGAQSITALQVHFGEREKNINRSYQCYCGFYTPSPCALAAHKRIHTETRPFVCPECGALFNEKATFSAHLQLMCLHYSRCPGYQCPKCGEAVVYSQLELVRSHVVTSHGETYYKCQACPMAFKSMTSFDAHRVANHGGATVLYKTIFKCPLCDTVFHQLQQQQQHMDTHMKDVAAKAKYAFKCAECKQFYDSKTALHDHMKTAHYKDMATRVCNMCFQPFASDAEWQRHLGPDGKCRRWKMTTLSKTSSTTTTATAVERESGGSGAKNGVAENVLSSTTPSLGKTGNNKTSEEPMVVDDDDDDLDDDDDDEVQEIANVTAVPKAEETTTTTYPVSGLLHASDEPRDLEEDIPEGVVRVIPVQPKEDALSDHQSCGGGGGDRNSPNKHPPSSTGRTNFAEVSNWLFQENYKLMCKVCFEQYHSITELTAHGRRHVQDGLNVCTHRYCQNLQFATRDALQAHVKSGHRTDLVEARPIIDIDHVPSKTGGGGAAALAGATTIEGAVIKDGAGSVQSAEDEDDQRGKANGGLYDAHRRP